MKYKPGSLLILLFIIWAGMQSYLLFSLGIMTTGEPPKYISEAQFFLDTRHFSTSNFWFYSTIIFLIAFSIKIKVGFGFIIAVQFIVNWLATFSIFHLVKKWFDPVTGFACALLFILNFPLQEFNVYVQSDSLFYSFAVLFAVYLLQMSTLTVQHLLIIVASLLLMSITRPTGLLFIPSTFIYLFVRFYKTISIKWKIAAVLLVTGFFLYILNNALGSGGEWDFMQPYLYEHIVCGVPTTDTVNIETTTNSNSVFGLLYYIVHNFGQFTRLAIRKAIAFFSLVRPYYSTMHNIFLAVLFYPLYILVIFSLRWWWKNNRMHLLLLISTISMVLGSVVLTCDDWHNRFFLTITPFLLLLGSPAISKMLTTLSRYVYPSK